MTKITIKFMDAVTTISLYLNIPNVTPKRNTRRKIERLKKKKKKKTACVYSTRMTPLVCGQNY
jgi:hypothetical protein